MGLSFGQKLFASLGVLALTFCLTGAVTVGIPAIQAICIIGLLACMAIVTVWFAIAIWFF